MASLLLWYLTFSWGKSLLFPVIPLLLSLFLLFLIFPFSSVPQSCPTLCQASLSITNSQSLLKLTSITSVMPWPSTLHTELLAIHQLHFRLPYLARALWRFQLVGFCSLYSPVCLSNLGCGILLPSLLWPHCHRSLALCDLPSLDVISLLLHV